MSLLHVVPCNSSKKKILNLLLYDPGMNHWSEQCSAGAQGLTIGYAFQKKLSYGMIEGYFWK